MMDSRRCFYIMRHHTTQAFTLIELLVVISIIALLIGILLPVLSSARESGRAVQCSSNLHQVSLGYAIYANDHRGLGVPGRMPNISGANIYNVGNGHVWRPRWYVTMGSSAGFYAFTNPNDVDSSNDNTRLVTHKIFVCPTVPERVNNRNFPYGYNHQFLGNSRIGSSGVAINFPVRVENLVSQTVLAGDALGTASGRPKSTRTPYDASGTASALTNVSNHGWSLDPPRLLPAAQSDYCDDANRADINRSATDDRHGGAANVSFIDGHVERLNRTMLGYVVNTDDSVEARTGAHNRLFSGTGRDDDPRPR